MNLKESKKRTILAVDDKIENLKVLIRYLENSGYELMVAQSGEEAFEHLERFTPDMILLDVLMPGIDGFETCRKLKKNKTTREIPVIFMTALTDTIDKVKGFEVGAIDYLTKPLQHEEVLARVNAHMTTVDFQQQLRDKNVLLQHKITMYGTLMQKNALSGPIIAESSAMRKLLDEIDALSQKSGPILISGEPGTGQVFMARKIHEKRCNKYAPLIVVDCQQIKAHEAGDLLFGSSGFETSIGKGKGFGAIHLAEKGTLILMNVEALHMDFQKILSRYLNNSEEDQYIADVNLIATTNEDMHSFVAVDQLLPALASQLTANVIMMPNMRQRKKDIIPLARQFLAERSKRLGGGKYKFSKSAEHVLLSGKYRHHNVEELREAIEFAALFAENGEVVAENLFTGPKNEGTPFEINITKRAPVKWFLRNKKAVLILQLFFLFTFIMLISVGLFAGDNQYSHIANSMIWGIWEPVLIFIFFFVGRIWCTVCPVSFIGRMFQWVKSYKLNPPKWLINYTGWIIVALVFLVVWSEYIFHMTEHPFSTSIFLLVLMLAAIIFSILFKREAWCRYLCPLGNIGAAYAVPAMIYVRANPGVCATQCDTHECYKGSKSDSACPVYHHPLYARDGHFCKMCLSCLRSCPHDSANMYFRAPIQSVWHLGDLSATLVPLALVGFLLALVLLGARSTTLINTPILFTSAAIFSVLLGIGLYLFLPRLFSGYKSLNLEIVTRVAFSLFILGWGPFMAYHLEEVPILSALQITLVEETIWTAYLSANNVKLLLILQFIVISGAWMIAIYSLSRILKKYRDVELEFVKSRWYILSTFYTLYLLVALLLILI